MDTWEVTFEDRPEGDTQTSRSHDSGINVGKIERIASAVGGGALVGYALKNRSTTGLLLALLGTGLLYRGVSGQCEAYRALGIDTANGSREGAEEDVARDVHVEKAIAINRTPQELYSFWREFENLPRFMENLESVTRIDETRSHWVATGPAGKRVEWDAEIYNEKENELIAWRSLPGADVTNAGSVHFEQAPGGRGTYVKVTLNYNPPGGKAGMLVAKLFGDEPGQLVEQNLRRLKQLIETGEISTTEGHPAGGTARAASAAAGNERKANKMSSKSPVSGLSPSDESDENTVANRRAV